MPTLIASRTLFLTLPPLTRALPAPAFAGTCVIIAGALPLYLGMLQRDLLLAFGVSNGGLAGYHVFCWLFLPRTENYAGKIFLLRLQTPNGAASNL